MFLIIAIGLTIGVYGLIVALYNKHLELQQKVNTSTANIIVDPEVHTNFEFVPRVHDFNDNNAGWIYGIKNKTIYYKKTTDYHYPEESIIRTKDTNYDMTKVGYLLCSFRQTLTGWVLLYRTIANPSDILFSIRDDSFTELNTYGPWTYQAEYTTLIYSYQYPYAWIYPGRYLEPSETAYYTIKMNILTGTYTQDEVPDFDGNYKFTGSIFEVDDRKIFVADYRDYLYRPGTYRGKNINNFTFFYDGTYYYYVPALTRIFSYQTYPLVHTYIPFKAVKING